jgi:hypothetical protein
MKTFKSYVTYSANFDGRVSVFQTTAAAGRLEPPSYAHCITQVRYQIMMNFIHICNYFHLLCIYIALRAKTPRKRATVLCSRSVSSYKIIFQCYFYNTV